MLGLCLPAFPCSILQKCVHRWSPGECPTPASRTARGAACSPDTILPTPSTTDRAAPPNQPPSQHTLAFPGHVGPWLSGRLVLSHCVSQIILIHFHLLFRSLDNGAQGERMAVFPGGRMRACAFHSVCLDRLLPLQTPEGSRLFASKHHPALLLLQSELGPWTHRKRGEQNLSPSRGWKGLPIPRGFYIRSFPHL